MSTYAALTDGTTTITFASPSYSGYYKIESGWGPRVAGLRQSQFGGRGPYEDVTEEIPVSVGGSNAAHLYANVSALKGLLDNANKWWRNEGASATLFKYSPEGATISSTGSPLQVATWGATLELPPGFPSFAPSGGAVWNTGLTMRFTRKGEWLHNTQTASVSGENGDVLTASFASAASFWSPIDLIITNQYTTSSLATAYVIISSSTASGIQYVDYGSGVAPYGDARWSETSAASAYNPNSASIARFDPSNSSPGSISLAPTPTNYFWHLKSYSVFASVKNNSTTVSYRLAVGLADGSLPLAYTNAATIPVGGSASNPIVYSFGMIVPAIDSSQFLWLSASPSASAASGNWLDVDRVYFVENESSYILGIRDDYARFYSGSTKEFHNYTTKTNPSIYTSGTNYLNYRGLFHSIVGSMSQIVLLSTEGSYFRQATGSAASLARSNTWTLTRTNAYLTPV